MVGLPDYVGATSLAPQAREMHAQSAPHLTFDIVWIKRGCSLRRLPRGSTCSLNQR